jgi:hypothetical protein
MNKFNVLLLDKSDAIIDSIVTWLDELHITYEMEVSDVSDFSYNDTITEFIFTNERDKLLFTLKWK